MVLASVALVAAGAGVGVGVGVASGDPQQGAAVDRARIDVDEPLEPGQRYELPELGVRNPGTAQTHYQMAAQPTDQAEHAGEAGWFAFSPDRFSLGPDDRQPVGVALHLPEDAEPGRYEVLLAAQVTPEGEGARVGGAAASRLTFDVVEPEPAATDPAPERGGAGPADGAGRWLPLTFLGALGIAGLLWLSHRYELRVQRR